MVVTKLNVDDVYATGEFLKSIGVTQFYATKASPPINSLEFGQYMLDHDELLRLLNQLHEIRENRNISVGALECYPLCSYLNQDKYSFMSDRRCSAGVTTCSIGADGTVRACSHDDVAYGNVMDDGLGTAWGAMQNWRDGSFIPSECKKCTAFAQCSAGCRVDAMYMSGCKSNLDPYAQPDQVRQITRRPVKQEVNLADAKLTVSRQLRFRDEGFCVLCASPKKIASPSTLSQASYGLIQSLQVLGAGFGLADVMGYTKLPVKEANALCNAFLDDGIFQLLSR
jgi:radical SAM protein with 4Fe4S-binding SPASM domain